MLQCYNKGCLQKFNAKDNTDKSCTYHPGQPVFHDVYKIWSCCNKKTTDFTVFLSTKGCAVGNHNSEKPAESVKANNKKVELENEGVVVNATKPPKCAPRIVDENCPKKKIPISIAQSLKSHLLNTDDADNKCQPTVTSDSEIPVGTQCRHPGCTKTYDKNISATDVCWYHGGSAIFHEGMKYWSCCQRKTSDFDTFLQQVGCTNGIHLWIQEKNETSVTECRYDYHQTGGDLYVTIYSKFPQPADTFVECDPVNVYAHVEFENGKSIFDLHIPLWGAIELNHSMVTLSAAKVEIKMRKKDGLCRWPRLAYIENRNVPKEEM